MHALGRVTQGEALDGDELEEIREDICAVVSKLDRLIAAKKECPLSKEG